MHFMCVVLEISQMKLAQLIEFISTNFDKITYLFIFSTSVDITRVGSIFDVSSFLGNEKKILFQQLFKMNNQISGKFIIFILHYYFLFFCLLLL